MTSPNYKL